MLGLVAATMILSGANADSGRRYYTDARIMTAKTNLQKYDWARKQRDEIIAKADKWAAYDDAKLRTLIAPPQVPRGYDVNNQGCPIHGKKLYETGIYSWIIDFDKPFKVTCPVGGEEYPSNDFAAYLASWMKDKSLLTGDYADDGWGWHKPDDESPANYWFVGNYTERIFRGVLPEAITNLSKAALLTDDKAQALKYAHKCALLLWQLAEYYPDYDYAKQSREGKEHNPNYQGKLVNHIWEALGVPVYCSQAYDAIKPFLAKDSELHKLAGKSSTEINDEIRDRVLMEAAKCITDGSGRITGNYGMHQKALLMLALVLNEKQKKPTSDEMVRFVLENNLPKTTVDMGLRDALVNLIFRDGVPRESLGYNHYWVKEITDIADMLVDCGVDIFTDPRYRKLLNWPFDVYVAGKFTPSLGDTGNMFSRGSMWTPDTCRTALRHIQDPRYAWVVKQAPDTGEDLFEPATDDLLAKFASKPTPTIGLKSFCFPAYGLANLQCGSDANRVASTLFFSPHSAHNHADQLNLMLFAYDNALLPDFGYPEAMDAFNYRLFSYFTNTIAHNTVTVDATKQSRGSTALHGLSMKGFAQVVDASCENAYPDKVSLYRRANMLVQVTPEHSYLFDVFYVRGGKQHDFAVHGTQADLVCEPSLGPVQKEGTLAGIDVPFQQCYDDLTLRDKPVGSVSYTGYRGSGFQFLTNVKRVPLQGVALCEWQLTEPLKGQPERLWKGIGLRAHLVGRDEELIACDGPVQHYATMPKSIKYVIRRRVGENLASCFTTVFEPYQGKTWIKRVSPVRIEPNDGNATAALVELVDGAKHYVFHSLTPEQKYTLDKRVTVSGQTACLVLDANQKPVKAMLLNGAQLRFGDYSVRGNGIRRSKIVSVDYAKGIIEIADPILSNDLGPDTTMLVKGHEFSSSVTLQKVIDKTHFSIGDEDLRVGGGAVLEVHDKEMITNVVTPNAFPGMTVLNSLYEPQGRLVKHGRQGWVVDRATPLKSADFPQTAGDSNPRYTVVMAAPGDEILLPDCVIKE